MRDIQSLYEDELCDLAESMGEKRFRGKQLFEWLHQKCQWDFDKMSNIPKAFASKIIEQDAFVRVNSVCKLVSEIDGTRKYLFEMKDSNVVESVLMKYEHGNSVCISSQVGCRMGCRFCASTVDGLVRNLTAGEMCGQVYGIINDIGERVSNVVIMGSGEPMDNYDEVVRFIRLLGCERGQNISVRNITLSSCGIVPGIMRLATEGLPITLALSLHATTDEKRKRIMPIAYKYPLKDVLAACKNYYEVTGRRLTLEYSLIAGENDSDEDVSQLIDIAADCSAHVNLIPVNPIKEREYVSTARNRVLALKNKLEKNHINVTIRREMGRDIQASCGQLRRSFIAEREN